MPDYVPRAITIPLHDFSGDWEILRDCLKNGSLLSRWCVRALLANDVVVASLKDKLPPYPPLPDTRYRGKALHGLYGMARKAFDMGAPTSWWAGASQSASIICSNAYLKYTKSRFQILVRGQKPDWAENGNPWPINGQSWKLADYDADGYPRLVVSLPGGQAALTLRGVGNKDREEFRRQLAIFDLIVKGQHPRLEVRIREERCSTGCHRLHFIDKANGGGQDTPKRILVTMVARIPQKEKPGNRVLTLITDPQSFWIAELDERRAWVLNNDHFKQGVARKARYDSQLQRLSQDRKADRQMGKRLRLRLNEKLQKIGHKQRTFMSTWLHTTAKDLLGFCLRQRIGRVYYRDEEKGFIPKFPWADLKGKLRAKLAEYRIALFCQSDTEKQHQESIKLVSDRGDQEWLRTMKLEEMASRKLLAAAGRSGSHPKVSVPCETSRTSPSPTRSTSSRGTSASRTRTPRSAASAKPAV